MEAPHDWDVSRPEIYAEDRWQPIFAEMRKHAPIHKIVDTDYGDFWSISTLKPIQHVEALPEIFSSEKLGITLVAKNVQEMPEEDRVPMPMFIAMDRPKHTDQRRVVAPAFAPSEMERLTATVRGNTEQVLDSLPVGKSFDWVDKVSIELTTGMLAILFDFPWEDRRKLTEWSDWAGNVELMKSDEMREKRLEKMYEMAGYFKALWDERLEAGEAPDLLSRMIHSDMRNMDPGTFMGNLILLIVGGNDTTRNTMSGYAYGLDQFPDEREKLEANPELIPNAVQEIIRWQTPLAHMKRTTTQDTELFGHHIPEGEKLALWYISANRDESVFEDPDRLMVDRENARRHLAFGYGIHRCVGARLAELQVRILLEEMAKRRLRANVRAEPVRVPACFVHGYRQMQVELTTY
ncbi:MAG: cytochrome P450 [Parasphingopyxis sp.]